MSIEKKLEGTLKKISKENLKFNERKFKEINNVDNSHLEKMAYRFPEEGSFEDDITIIPLSDIHLGSKQCNLGKLQMAIDLIMETENCYTILMGDQTETATKTSVGMGTYDEDYPLDEQIRIVTRMLKPLAKEGKILGCLMGNHEMRVAYHNSINIVKMIADELEVNYFGFQGYMSIHVGENNYQVMAHHGTGSASTPAGKLRAMRKLNKVSRMDLYLSGHTHARTYDFDINMAIDEEEMRVVPEKIFYVVCGSFMEYWDGYAEMKLLSPSSTGIVAINLSSKKKDIEILI